MIRRVVIAILLLVLLAWWADAGFIETEANDCLNAENADRLLTEDQVSGTDCLAGAPACPKTLATLGVGC